MGIKFRKGNIFNSKCQTVVNTVNCVGVMGKGIAQVYKLRYPSMFEEYKEHCSNKLIKPGILWLYKKQENAPWILNFPTKFHWKYPSKIEWIEDGLLDQLDKDGIGAIAFSPLNQGILTDKYLKGFPEDSRAVRDGRYLQKSQLNEEILFKVGQLNKIAKARNQSLAQMAIAWILRHDTISSVLVGASKSTQLLDSIKALDNLEFDDASLTKIDQILN